MTLETFCELAKPRTIVPVFRRFNADFLTPVMAYFKIRNKKNYSFLLESVIKGEQLGRYSFIGSFQIDEIEAKVTIKKNKNNKSNKYNFFSSLKEKLAQYSSVTIPDLPRFTCGAVGYIGYDMIHEIEEIPSTNPDYVNIPDAIFGFYQNLIAFDHLKNQVILITNVFIKQNSNLNELYQNANNELDKLLETLNAPQERSSHFSAELDCITSNFTKKQFEAVVRKSKEYIFAGDIFQVVLSQKNSIPFQGDIFQVYRALRNVNPSPYLFFLDFLDFQLIGSSPEPLIRVENKEAEIIPIAGTRPRGKTLQEDIQNEESLLNDPKELAEHIMLVDLARNDMGRVSKYGTVQVEDFKTIEKYSHVMHIISRVKGKLKKKYDSVDAFKAAFPAGTVSGAPKIRAMEIIDELEPEKRGFYAGAIGYFDYNGNMDMCIAIRTMLAKGSRIYFQAGAGIVADSVPETEFFETINKGNALRKAIEQATGGLYDFIH
jgi:anthranilate synthase component 1